MAEGPGRPGRLDGTATLVTGASSGIGAATARALAAEGARVVLVARRKERLLEVAKECPGAEIVALDVRDANAADRELGRFEVDVLVANAGLSIGMEKLPDGNPEDWAVAIDTNVKGILHTIHAVVPCQCRSGSGRFGV